MSSDSDEPLSALKNKPTAFKPLPRVDPPPKKVRKIDSRKRKKKKLITKLRSPVDDRKFRYYASQAPIERPHDVWLYMKDLNLVGPYSCLLCAEWFINKSRLVVHYVLNHKKDYCGICRYFVDHREAWTKHTQFHIPMTCSQCPQKFLKECDLRTHFLDEHSSVHCRFCGFMLPNDQYHHHLFQRHSVTNVANKDLPSLWDTEYEGSPKFSCALCLESGTPSIDFFKHYMSIHKLTLKCFTAMLSGLDPPFTVYGANVSSSFLETALKNHAKVGYVERDGPLHRDNLEGNMNLLQTLIPEIKQEALSDAETEDKTVIIEMFVENVTNEKNQKKSTDPDPILSYKGAEDFDVTLTELVIMNKFYVDYISIALRSSECNTVAVESKIIYTKPAEDEIACSMCTDRYPNAQSLGSHMVKMHCVKNMPTFFCRLCTATFDTEAELRTHSSEELREFDDLWICQFCDMEFEGRDGARRHLTDHWNEMTVDNCFSPHLGFKCRYCPTLFWSELDRETHQGKVHYEKRKEDFYKCSECDGLFSDKVCFVHHFSETHSSSLPYMMKCAVCCRVFTTVDKIKEHFIVEHPEAKKIFCSLGTCKYRPFSQSKSFKMHLQTFHGRDAKPQEGFTCVVCARQFPSARACASHATLAHGPGRFKCKFCDETLQSNDERKLHLMLVHPGQKPFSCNICGRTFLHKSSLYMHRTEHKVRRELKCEYCDKQFLKKDSYRDHMLIHEGPRHTCTYCPMTFVQRSNMLRHERRHTGERPYTCAHCGRSFSDKGALNSHVRIHEPHEVYPCAYCGQTFSQKTKLRYHLRKHTGRDLEACRVCSKLFTSVYSLREHMKTHETGHASDCADCGKRFQTVRYLERHIRTNHTGKSGVYPCPLCELTSANPAALRYHVLTHSSIKHVKCGVCFSSYSSRKSVAKHLVRKHGMKGTPDTLQSMYSELDPRQCGLKLDEETMTNIFGPKKKKKKDLDVVVGDYITIKDIPVKERDHTAEVEEAEEDKDEEDEKDEDDENATEEEAVPDAVLKKRKKITYHYEVLKKKKKRKKKKHKREKEREEESSPEREVEPTNFVAVKLEPTDHGYGE